MARAKPYRRLVPTLGGVEFLPTAESLERLRLIKGAGASRTPSRDPAQRRAYAERRDPQGYISDIFGYRLTPQQEEALDIMLRETRLLIPAGNNLGKTFLLACYGIYLLDAVASILNEFGQEQGARILLPGPDHPTVYATVYSQMLVHARRAEERGYLMPGRRSENSVLWKVRPTWEVEAFAPPHRAHQQVAHTVSGRHHVVQVALIEEGQGVPESVWRATEGMCSAAGNVIISSFNPTEGQGPAFDRAKTGNYRVLHLDALEHPNVLTRSIVVPGAVDFAVVDARVRECKEQGDYPAVHPDPAEGDFIYALPPRDAVERGPRTDGHLGHPDYPLKVFRPIPLFISQVRGRWPPRRSGHFIFAMPECWPAVYSDDETTLDATPAWLGKAKAARAAWEHCGGWDFGSGDSLLVCLFGLVEWTEYPRDFHLWIDDELTWRTTAWRQAAADVCLKLENYGGPRLHYGDPAGTSADSAQTSWETNLQAGNVPLWCLPTSANTSDAQDWAIREIQHLLDSGRLHVHRRCRVLREAMKEWRRDVPQFVDIDFVSRVRIPPRKDIYSHPCQALIYMFSGVLMRLKSRLAKANGAGAKPAPERADEFRGPGAHARWSAMLDELRMGG